MCVETKAGETRRGVDPDGSPWETKMKYDYGFLRGKEGEDGDSLDVFLGPHEESELVTIVHQKKIGTEEFDEEKVMLGFTTKEEAVQAYKKSYDNPSEVFGGSTTLKMEEFQRRLKAGEVDFRKN